MALERMSTDQCKLIIRADKTPVGENERPSNAPTVNEGAIVMVEDESYRRDIIIQKKDKCLSICGKALLQLGLPVPTRQAHHTLDRDLLREANYDINILQNMVQTNKPRLTEDQRTAYEAVMNLIAEGNGNILFLDAPVGTEKNVLINFILAEIRSNAKIDGI
ncbi:hypothetical protein AVEN_175904-1 [Araneus ventricosus]|uniref:ATP-dependent DNA helicase n=1 Tax=Araneus ventricosus TaxID=182803 RepID=A0A4Y2EC55_ARAVE|nr:hypothetical protein AVEN_175904-1 [Araneus ventricosus]